MRTLEEVQKEYAQHCAQVGENYYRSKAIEQQTQVGLQKISDLTKEADEINKAKAETKVPEVVEAAPEAKPVEASL